MALAALRFAGNYQEQKVNQLFPDTKLEKMYAQLDSDPEFYGAGVTFIGYNSELSNYLITGIERESLFFPEYCAIAAGPMEKPFTFAK